MIAVLAGFGLGCVVVATATALARGDSSHGSKSVEDKPHCTCAVVLWGVPPGDAVATKIDAESGKVGFSHCSFISCEVDEYDRELIIDCTLGEGVRRKVMDTAYPRRPNVKIYFQGVCAAEIYGCMRAKMGLGFDWGRLLGATPKSDAECCSGLIIGCMPRRYRDLIERYRVTPKTYPLSPNDIAVAFGITGLQSADVMVSQ